MSDLAINLPEDFVGRVQNWQITRTAILTAESDTGYLNTDAIQDNDDEAVALCDWLASLISWEQPLPTGFVKPVHPPRAENQRPT